MSACNPFLRPCANQNGERSLILPDGVSADSCDSHAEQNNTKEPVKHPFDPQGDRPTDPMARNLTKNMGWSTSNQPCQSPVPSTTSIQERAQDPAQETTPVNHKNQAMALSSKIHEHHRQLKILPTAPINVLNFTLLPSNSLSKQLQNLITVQETFRRASSPCAIDIGFHYTYRQNLLTIASKGLLTKSERCARGVKPVKVNGSSYGDGIYTGNNALAFLEFQGADTCLFVARLVGTIGKYGSSTNDGTDKHVHTFVHRENAGDPDTAVVVLRSSSQCAVLASFPCCLAKDEAGNDMIYEYHKALQGMIDAAMNGGVPSCVRKVSQIQIHRRAPQAGQPVYTQLTFVNYTASRHPIQIVTNNKAQGSLKKNAKASCCICWESLNGGGATTDNETVAEIATCNHRCHLTCLNKWLEKSNECPLCQRHVGGDQCFGTMPSGKMIAVHCALPIVPGHGMGVIVIDYAIDASIQQDFHPHPGVKHGSTTRRAYLPATKEGRLLLQRLKYAFQHGLTFAVGTSQTTQQTDQVVWSSISHKTTLVPYAPFGFPDLGYIRNANAQLDALKVPQPMNLPLL